LHQTPANNKFTTGTQNDNNQKKHQMIINFVTLLISHLTVSMCTELCYTCKRIFHLLWRGNNGNKWSYWLLYSSSKPLKGLNCYTLGMNDGRNNEKALPEFKSTYRRHLVNEYTVLYREHNGSSRHPLKIHETKNPNGIKYNDFCLNSHFPSEPGK